MLVENKADMLTGDSGSQAARAREEFPLGALVQRMALGEQDALGDLYDQTCALLNGLLLRILQRPEDAEEALADVYMKAWKSAAQYSPDRGSVESWLVIMARSIAIDRIRHKRAQPNLAAFDSDSEFVSQGASPEEETGAAQRQEHMRRVLMELPPEQRQVLTMAFFGGLSHSELAARLGQPLGTVKSRIRAALLRLRQLLEEGTNGVSIPHDEEIAAMSLLAGLTTPVSPARSLKARVMTRIAQYESLKPLADLRTYDGEWTAVGIPGVEIRNLFRDRSTGRTTMLVRMQPGVRFPSHLHHDDEQCLVIEGDIRWGELVYEKGDFVVMGKSTTHPEIHTETGNVLLIIAGRNEFVQT